MAQWYIGQGLDSYYLKHIFNFQLPFNTQLQLPFNTQDFNNLVFSEMKNVFIYVFIYSIHVCMFYVISNKFHSDIIFPLLSSFAIHPKNILSVAVILQEQKYFTSRTTHWWQYWSISIIIKVTLQKQYFISKLKAWKILTFNSL